MKNGEKKVIFERAQFYKYWEIFVENIPKDVKFDALAKSKKSDALCEGLRPSKSRNTPKNGVRGPKMHTPGALKITPNR